MHRSVIVLPLVVLLAGCISDRRIRSDFVRTRSTPHPTLRRHAGAVEVYIAERPTRPFAEIGFVEVQEAAGHYTSSELVGALRARAGREGCNAVVFLGDNDRMWTSTSTSTSTSTTPDATGSGSTTTTKTSTSDEAGTQHGYRGACLVYLGPLPAVRTTAVQMRK